MSEMDSPPKMEQFWEDPPSSRDRGHNLDASSHQMMSNGSSSNSGSGNSQYERNLNFATGAVEENEYGFPKKKTVRDPMSHRIIEKRRRDRMNNCLADLARLLPPSSLRKGRGRIEKTEIVELAIKHLRHLQCHPCPSGDKCEFNYIVKGSRQESQLSSTKSAISSQLDSGFGSSGTTTSTFPSTLEDFRLGFHECMSETMHFLVEEEGMYPGDSLCVRILKHLRTHSDTLMRDHYGKDGKLSLTTTVKEETKIKSEKSTEFNNTSGSTSSGYQPNNGSSSGSDGNCGQDVECQESFVHPIPSASQRSSSTERAAINFDFEGENSCCSTQLSLDISDVFSADGKNNARISNKPPIPAIICSSSSINSSPALLSSSNGRSSDEGQEGTESSSNSHHQYKFKNNIKQRFNADLIPSDYQEQSTTQQRKKSGLVTKASLKHNQESLQSSGAMSDNEEEESSIMKLRNSSPVEPDDECRSNKSYCTTSSTRRDSMSSRAITRAIANTPENPEANLNTPTVTTSSENKDEETAAGKRRQGNEQLLKPIEINHFTKSPLPIILGGDSLGPNVSGKGGTKGMCVPAFALHDKGLYYVPLMIEKSVLSPYLANVDPSTSPPLHPVTISVCFLLSQAERLARGGPNFNELGPVIPVTSPSVSVISTERLTPFPVTLPIVTSASVNPATIKLPKSSRDSASNFIINRFSQSRQYNPVAYRYPITTTSHGNQYCNQTGSSLSISTPQNFGHKDMLSHQQYYPGYYATAESHSSSSSLFPGTPPAHLPGGYGSSSSSSSNSSINSSSNGTSSCRMNRKRSVSSMSQISGSGSGSSLGYHSLHDKYPPNTQDFYSYPTNTHANAIHSHIQSHIPVMRHHPGVTPSHHYASNHLLSVQSGEKRGVCSESERNRRSCSPSKRTKKSREHLIEVLKPKPMTIGLPVIPLPPSV